MNEIVKVDYTSDKPTVWCRELHKALKIKTQYSKWFDRMCEYGFAENSDFVAVSQKRPTAQGNETTYIDHQITIDMAKQLCMIQRTEIGKKCREYFIKIENSWNSDEMVMARALQITNKKLRIVSEENDKLRIEVSEMKPKADYADSVCDDKTLFTTTAIAKDFGMSARVLNTLLNSFGVQYRSGNQWVLYAKHQNSGYTHCVNVPKRSGRGYTAEMKWTQTGKYFVHTLLRKNGFVPTCELKAR